VLRPTDVPAFTARLAAVPLAVLLAGCSTETVQCGPCPPPVFANVDSPGLPAGSQVRLCVEDRCETVEVPPSGALASVSLHPTRPLRDLGGLLVTVEATVPGGSGTLTGSGRLRVTINHGTCACSYASTTVRLPGVDPTMTPLPTPLLPRSTPTPAQPLTGAPAY